MSILCQSLPFRCNLACCDLFRNSQRMMFSPLRRLWTLVFFCLGIRVPNVPSRDRCGNDKVSLHWCALSQEALVRCFVPDVQSWSLPPFFLPSPQCPPRHRRAPASVSRITFTPSAVATSSGSSPSQASKAGPVNMFKTRGPSQ